MIINEKQIMQLMAIGREAVELSEKRAEHWEEWGMMVAGLLDDIDNQQSEELKKIE